MAYEASSFSRFPDHSPADAEPVRQCIFVGQLCTHRQPFIQNIPDEIVLNALCQRLILMLISSAVVCSFWIKGPPRVS